MKSRLNLLGGYKSCHALQKELKEKNAKIALLEKESCVAKLVECALYQGLVFEVEAYRAAKTRPEEENTYLWTILS